MAITAHEVLWKSYFGVRRKTTSWQLWRPGSNVQGLRYQDSVGMKPCYLWDQSEMLKICNKIRVLQSLDISRYIITRYRTQHNNSDLKASVTLPNSRKTPIQRPYRRAMGVFHESFWEKSPQDIGSALYFAGTRACDSHMLWNYPSPPGQNFVFWFEFHWSLFLRVQLTTIRHWFR